MKPNLASVSSATTEEIEAHEDFGPTYQRWYSVALAAGRDKKAAHERAYGMAYAFIAKRLRSREYLRKHIGPNPSFCPGASE